MTTPHGCFSFPNSVKLSTSASFWKKGNLARVHLRRVGQVRFPPGGSLQPDLCPGDSHPLTHEPPEQKATHLWRLTGADGVLTSVTCEEVLQRGDYNKLTIADLASLVKTNCPIRSFSSGWTQRAANSQSDLLGVQDLQRKAQRTEPISSLFSHGFFSLTTS